MLRLCAIPMLLVVVLLVGFGVLNAQLGAISVLALLVVSGIGWRLVKLFVGSLLILLSFV